MTPIQASKKSNDILVYTNLQDRRGRQQPKFKLGQSVRTAEFKRVFNKGESTKWSYNLCTITKVIHDTNSSYKIDYIPERYKENLLKPTELSSEANNQVVKEVNLIQ